MRGTPNRSLPRANAARPHAAPRWAGGVLCCAAWLASLAAPGCATIRVTDPPRSATEQFLLSVAATRAVDQLSAQGLRDRAVFVDSSYFNAPEQAYVIGELRAKLLSNGVRLVDEKSKARIVLEVRSGGVGVDRREYLLGLPSVPLPGFNVGGGVTGGSSTAGAILSTPELAIIKNTRQSGFASVAFIAYWAETGEVVFSSGPFTGRSLRDDYWILGTGPRTVGNIPPTEQISAPSDAKKKGKKSSAAAPAEPPAPAPPATMESPTTQPGAGGG